jgi:hypothetical protein
MGEEARILGESPFKAVLYCSMLRSSIASRAQRRDGSLDIAKAFREVDKTILKAVETRLSSVTQAIGAQQKAPAASAPAQQGTSGQDADMMAKQQAALDEMQRKAKQTLDAITKASKGNGRAQRRDNFIADKIQKRGDEKADKKGDKSKGKGKGKAQYNSSWKSWGNGW